MTPQPDDMEKRFEKRFNPVWLDLKAYKRNIKQFIRSERSLAFKEIKKKFEQCLYDKQWVELGEPQNFEAGKVNITAFEKFIDSLK